MDDDVIARIRAGVGQSAIRQMDMLDDELTDAIAEVVASSLVLEKLLLERSVGVRDRVQLFAGLAIAAGMDEDP